MCSVGGVCTAAWCVQIKRMIEGIGNMLLSTYLKLSNGKPSHFNWVGSAMKDDRALAVNTVKTDQGSFFLLQLTSDNLTYSVLPMALDR